MGDSEAVFRFRLLEVSEPESALELSADREDSWRRPGGCSCALDAAAEPGPDLEGVRRPSAAGLSL